LCGVGVEFAVTAVGRATLTMVASTLMTKTLRQMKASAAIG